MRINISTGMTPKDLVKVSKVAMLKSYLFSPCPELWAQYKELNMITTPFAFGRVLLFWKVTTSGS